MFIGEKGSNVFIAVSNVNLRRLKSRLDRRFGSPGFIYLLGVV